MSDEEPKKADPRHIRRDFYRLAVDWVHLHTSLPKPLARNASRPPAYRDYGHPAEWASDKAAQIAGILHDWHDLLAEARNETPPPPAHTAEAVRVINAWRYLEPRIEQLCILVDADDLKEVAELHWQIRSALGHTNPKQVLPVPCPGHDCGLRTLTRRVAVGKERIECGACGMSWPEELYPHLVRVVIDALLDATDSDNSDSPHLSV